jgi:hypothetical protein
MDSSKLPPKGFIAANSPEMMPWDTLLNQDVHFCVDRHVVATNDYPAKETRKFDLSTPKHAAWAYHRILKICLPSPRIIHDVLGVLKSMEIVWKGKGIKVDGIGNTNYGKRYGKVKNDKSGRLRVCTLSTYIYIRVSCATRFILKLTHPYSTVRYVLAQMIDDAIRT